MKVVLIEDEPLMAEALREEILLADPSIEILAHLSSIEESIDYLNTYGFPDLFFSDIELTDGLSFEIFKRVNNTTPIIFCTAYNHYALEAFQVCGIDYLLKPFHSNDIVATLQKYQSMFAGQSLGKMDFQALFKQLQVKSSPQAHSILVHLGEKIIPIEKTKIALAEISNGQVYVHTFTQKRLPVNYNMDTLFKLLGERFYRVNRQYIIQRPAIDHVSQYFARKVLVVPCIPFTEKLIVSKANVSHFFKWLESQ